MHLRHRRRHHLELQTSGGDLLPFEFQDAAGRTRKTCPCDGCALREHAARDLVVGEQKNPAWEGAETRGLEL